jgi:hypothetical protein
MEVTFVEILSWLGMRDRPRRWTAFLETISLFVLSSARS